MMQELYRLTERQALALVLIIGAQRPIKLSSLAFQMKLDPRTRAAQLRPALDHLTELGLIDRFKQSACKDDVWYRSPLVKVPNIEIVRRGRSASHDMEHAFKRAKLNSTRIGLDGKVRFGEITMLETEEGGA